MKWISIINGLPDIEGKYLVCLFSTKEIKILSFTKNKTPLIDSNWLDEEKNIYMVDYWMPLPEFPFLSEKEIICDSVHHPSHYTAGKFECIDYILDKKLDFPRGNAVKYITRAGHKHDNGMCITDKAIEDLKKAKQYIDFEIEHLEGKR